MTQAEQAVLIWPVLVFAARMQRVVTYGELEGLTGIDARGQHEALGRIHSYCERKHYPSLNSIAVSADGFPGDGYPTKMTPIEFLVERARVFAFGWSVKEKPRSQDFEALQSASA
jgi:hypothetical protein